MHSNLNEFFSKENSISRKSAETIVNNTLFKCDDGELFLESTVSESLLLDDGKIKNTSYDSSKGYGLRSVNNDITTYSHSNELTEESLKNSAKIILDANKNYSNPFKGEDENFDEYYPNLYILNSKSLFFKIIEKNATKNLKRYLSDVKKNKEYYSQNFPNTFLLNINQQDYKNSATKLVIMYNFYYNTEINLSNLFDNSKNR
mgnify:CR=1 FL=1